MGGAIKQLVKNKRSGKFVHLQSCSESSVAEHFGDDVLRAKENSLSVLEDEPVFSLGPSSAMNIHPQYLIGRCFCPG